jgi:hypothetical protein
MQPEDSYRVHNIRLLEPILSKKNPAIFTVHFALREYDNALPVVDCCLIKGSDDRCVWRAKLE